VTKSFQDAAAARPEGAESILSLQPLAATFSDVKSASQFSIVLVTAPDLKTARALGTAALQAKLIACANLVPRIESHYWWQGKIESGAEVLLVLKTRPARLAALEKLVLARHPYETPEFLVLAPSAGSRKYLAWLAGSCR
jgi:periplasmic divalent cation tolerance protein